MDSKPMVPPLKKGYCTVCQVRRTKNQICATCHADGWRGGKEMALALGKDKSLKTYNTVDELLEILPPYLHISEEENRLYIFISRTITGEWCVSYFTGERHYHTQTRVNLRDALNDLNNEIKE